MWRHIVIEGYCLGNDPPNIPCGRHTVSSFCLQNRHCPYFYYTDSNEREASWFVPLHLVIWDRIITLIGPLQFALSWYLWGRWFLKKDLNKLKESPRFTECPEWDTSWEEETHKEFPKWLEEVKSGK